MAEAQDAHVKLYWLNKSRAQNILWLLEELNVKYDVELFHRSKETMLAPPELSKVHPLGKADKLRQCPELFDYVLNQCCSKHGSGGDKFWESFTNQTMYYMNTIGLVPTIRTYTSMMEGWKIAKRLRSVQLLWNQVVESGMELDHHIWSSRISANGALGNPNAGMKVLTEMQAIWEESVANGTQHKAVKPDISSVNAAISGFLRNDRMSSVQDVLAWANSQRIEPDIFTYNKLLGYMLKKGRMEEADNILSSMKNSGINPDSATFTIILETALAEMSMQDPDAQRVTVRRVFAEMATCGLEPNQQTYAKMLHLLVRSGDGAKVPIEAVLSHLRASGLQPSPQICTILFEYYFSRRPRDWDAIRALITDRRSRTRVLTDRIFWETVMRHFHAAGEKHLAMIEQLLETVPDGGSYICGKTLSAADILLSFALIAGEHRFDAMGEWPGGSAKAAHPKVFEYIQRLKQEPGYKRSTDKIRELDGEFEEPAALKKLLAETVAKGASVRHQSTVPAASTFTNSTKTTRSNHDATKRHKHVPTHKPSSATSERIPRGSNDGNAKRRALDLFESTINSARRSESQAEADTQKLHQIARNIDAILHNARENPEEPYAAALYACVVDDILPLLRQSDSGLLPQFAYSKATEALRAVLEVKVNACDDPTLPRASELCGTLAEIGMKTPGRLDPFLGLLNWLIAKTPAEVDAAGSPSVDSALFDQRLLEDLLGCWKGLSLSRHAYKARGLDTRRPTPRNPRNISDPLYNCHVEFPLLVSLDPKKLVVVLATTFVLLSDPRAQSAASTEALEAVKKELKVFVQPFDAARLESHFTANPALWEYVAPRIDWAPLQARIQSKPKQPIEFHSPTKTAHANVKPGTSA
ncbi:hypothetical protein BN1723_012560 [Verticillium longisporum]|uniref:Uncharacterized protein n=1 Tax=Verticillium longisporum TaxID=100787 RepID=A0A0G4LK61_VERLO|nr:hypothetical protein BN1723_012560 [Verticillium longisporum]